MTLLAFNDNDVSVEQLQIAEDRTFINDAVLSATLGSTVDTGSVEGATNASPIVVTSTAHGLSNGDQVVIWGVRGNTAANGTATVANATADTFELSGVAGNGAHEGGGTWAKVVAGAASVSLDYVSGSQGRYVGVFPGTLSLEAGRQYKLIVRASNYNLEWVRSETARERT